MGSAATVAALYLTARIGYCAGRGQGARAPLWARAGVV